VDEWLKGKSYQGAQMGDNIQDTLHCEEVETNLSKLIPDDKKDKALKRIDLFVLSAAACLHDIGKVVDDNAKGWKSDHGKLSMQITLEEYEKLLSFYGFMESKLKNQLLHYFKSV